MPRQIQLVPLDPRLFLAAAGPLVAVLAIAFLPRPLSLALAASAAAASAAYIASRLRPLRPLGGGQGVDADFIYYVLHMLSVATGKPPRDAIFRVTSDPEQYPKYYHYSRKIYMLGKEWGYGLAKAAKIVSDEIRNKIVSNFFSRLSSVLAVGEDLERFLSTEYKSLMNEYYNYYNRLMNSARVFMGMYVTMLGSLVFILSNFLLLTFFFGASQTLILITYGGVMLAMLSILALFYKLLPKEMFEYKSGSPSGLYKAAKVAGLASLSAAAIVGTYIILSRGLSYESLSATLVLGGLLLAPAGLLAKRMEKSIREVDEFFPIFVRSFGSHVSILASVVKSLESILVSELGRLNKLLKRLYARLVNGVDPRVSWQLFSAESMSDLVRRAVRILSDSMEYGADLSKVGVILSENHNEFIRLRRLRAQVSDTFETTIYIMHVAAIMIATFISSLILKFSEILAALRAQVSPELADVFMFGALDPGVVTMSTLVFSIIVTLANSLALTRASPGATLSVFYYASLLALSGGAAIWASSRLIDYIIGLALRPEVPLPL